MGLPAESLINGALWRPQQPSWSLGGLSAGRGRKGALSFCVVAAVNSALSSFAFLLALLWLFILRAFK